MRGTFGVSELRPDKRSLYSEVRAVDVSADNGDTSPRPPVFRDSKGNQGTLVSKGRGDMVKRFYHA